MYEIMFFKFLNCFFQIFRVGLKKVYYELKKLKWFYFIEFKYFSIKENYVFLSKDDLCFGEIRSSDDDDDGFVEYDYLDLIKFVFMWCLFFFGDDFCYQLLLKLKLFKFVGKIQFMLYGISDLMKFSDMIIGEVVDLFKQIMLLVFVLVCEKEGLDGSFLSLLSDIQLKIVFKFSDLQLIKVNKIINDGWCLYVNQILSIL